MNGNSILTILCFLSITACHNTPTKSAQIPSDNTRPNADQIIRSLDLQAHVEGGYYRRTFQADHRPQITTDNGDRYLMTSIFYLLTEVSPIGHFHVNQSDILHYFHLGDPLEYTLIHPSGELEHVTLGPDPTLGHRLQLTVPGGVWKASRLLPGDNGYGLISEAVSPGFDFDDMTLGKRETLQELFPQHAHLVKTLTR